MKKVLAPSQSNPVEAFLGTGYYSCIDYKLPLGISKWKGFEYF